MGKYLSAETFGYKVNSNGKTLKKKQVWILEPSGDGDTIVLRSHLNKYIAVDQFGNVTCDQDDKDETSKFEISVSDDFSGRWAFKSMARGYFLGASSDTLICTAKHPGDAELWYVHLAARPQVNLLSVGRKRFAHLSDDQREIHVEENVPWGEDTLFTLEFREEANKYSIHTCNNMYLQRDGKLVPAVNKDCYFACEYHGGFIALRDPKGQYLAPIGSRAALKTRSAAVTKDELFDMIWLEDGSVAFKANNGKFVGTKKSGHLYANCESVDEPNAKYYFYLINRPVLVLKCDQGFVGYKSSASNKLECNKATYETIQVERAEGGQVHFKGQNGKYWHTHDDGISCDAEIPQGFFLELREPTRMCIKSTGGQYVVAEKNGGFTVGSTDSEGATRWEY